MSRMLQVNSMLQKTLAEIFSQKMEIPFDFFITITRVDCASDLKTASVFVSILPFAQAENGLRYLINERKEIQLFLGKSINLKYTPKLRFLLDESEETREQVTSLMD